jgi:fatty acyl-CoA reductase
MGETPKPDCHLDIEAELELVSEVKATLTAHSATEDTSSQQLEKKTMEELGLKKYMCSTYIRHA